VISATIYRYIYGIDVIGIIIFSYILLLFLMKKEL